MDQYLTQLPNEVLVKIFAHLSVKELIVIEEISERYRDIIYRKKYVKSLDFRRCYHLTGTDLINFCVISIRRSYIRELNLNDCSWLKPDDFYLLKALATLTKIHLLRCNVAPILIDMISSFKLTDLSFSWNDVILEGLRPRRRGLRFLFSSKNRIIGNALGNLKKLEIEVTYRSQFYDLSRFFELCPGVESLILRELNGTTKQPGRLGDFFSSSTRLSSLKEFKLLLKTDIDRQLRNFVCGFATLPRVGFWMSSGGALTFIKLLDASNIPNENPAILQDTKFLNLSLTFGNDVNGNISYYLQALRVSEYIQYDSKNCEYLCLDTFTVNNVRLASIANKYPKLRHLCLRDSMAFDGISDISRGLEALSEKCLHLTELSLINAHYFGKYAMCKSIAKLTGLEKLSLAFCGIIHNIGSNDLKKFEVLLAPIAESCVRLQVLIIDVSQCLRHSEEYYGNFIKNNDLKCLTKLTQLKMLKLMSWPIVYESFFRNLCQSSHLQILHLIDVGFDYLRSYRDALIKALPYCTELVELRLQCDRGVIPSIFIKNSLRNCLKLEILWLSSFHDVGINCNEVISLLKLLPRLIYFVLIIAKLPQELLSAVRGLNEEMKKSRPAFEAVVTDSIDFDFEKSIFWSSFDELA